MRQTPLFTYTRAHRGCSFLKFPSNRVVAGRRPELVNAAPLVATPGPPANPLVGRKKRRASCQGDLDMKASSSVSYKYFGGLEDGKHGKRRGACPRISCIHCARGGAAYDHGCCHGCQSGRAREWAPS